MNIDQKCGFFRRILIIIYDLLLLYALLFILTLLLLLLTSAGAIESGNIFYTLFVGISCYFYFTSQWIYFGRTLGMRAWRVRIRSSNDNKLNWADASKRFFLACLSTVSFGAGFIWSLLDSENMTFHDRYSKTILIEIDK